MNLDEAQEEGGEKSRHKERYGRKVKFPPLPPPPPPPPLIQWTGEAGEAVQWEGMGGSAAFSGGGENPEFNPG